MGFREAVVLQILRKDAVFRKGKSSCSRQGGAVGRAWAMMGECQGERICLSILTS